MTDIFEKRDEVLEEWVRTFMATSELEPDEYYVGFDEGEKPVGVKIIFDGYAEDDDGENDTNSLSFAVFIHRDSVNGTFPEHDAGPWNLIIHRPSEEMHFFVWYDIDVDSVIVIPEDRFAETNMDEEEAQNLFLAVVEKSES